MRPIEAGRASDNRACHDRPGGRREPPSKRGARSHLADDRTPYKRRRLIFYVKTIRFGALLILKTVIRCATLLDTSSQRIKCRLSQIISAVMKARRKIRNRRM